MLLSLLHFAISCFSKITWKIMLIYVDTIIQFSKYMFFFALPKDNYFLCFSPLPLDGDILRFF